MVLKKYWTLVDGLLAVSQRSKRTGQDGGEGGEGEPRRDAQPQLNGEEGRRGAGPLPCGDGARDTIVRDCDWRVLADRGNRPPKPAMDGQTALRGMKLRRSWGLLCNSLLLRRQGSFPDQNLFSLTLPPPSPRTASWKCSIHPWKPFLVTWCWLPV